SGANVTAHELDALFDVVVSVDENGVNIQDRNGLLKQDRLTVVDLEQAATSHPDLVAGHLDGPAIIEANRKFVELNSAFWNMGLLIRIPAKVKVENGILVRYNLTRPGSMLIPKLVVTAEEGSDAKIVEVYQ